MLFRSLALFALRSCSSASWCHVEKDVIGVARALVRAGANPELVPLGTVDEQRQGKRFQPVIELLRAGGLALRPVLAAVEAAMKHDVVTLKVKRTDLAHVLGVLQPPERIDGTRIDFERDVLGTPAYVEDERLLALRTVVCPGWGKPGFANGCELAFPKVSRKNGCEPHFRERLATSSGTFESAGGLSHKRLITGKW